MQDILIKSNSLRNVFLKVVVDVEIYVVALSSALGWPLSMNIKTK